jgi:RsiW-degrading membrane proteinase PrsW (M82 family)
MMRDQDGQFSSKRFVTVGAFLLLSVAFLVDVFIDIDLPEYVWDDMMYVVAAGIGFTASERFTKIIERKKEEENPPL